MSRPVTLFTGQWADLPLEKLAQMASEWGYDGLELGCWGDHMEVDKAVAEDDYCDKKLALLKKYGLSLYSISTHLAGQLVCDPNDERAHVFAPPETHGDPEKIRAWGVDQVKKAAIAANRLGLKVVNGFTGSSIWHMIYFFPPVEQKDVDEGFEYFAKMWNPILDTFKENGVRFGLEVHPTEIAYDIFTAERALDALDHREEFGFNFDPSHLLWQGIDPVKFIERFPDRIYHVHMKDASIYQDGEKSILTSHLPFGDAKRGWDFRSPGRGQVNFDEIIRALNHINYTGPLSIEWEDSGMDREMGAKEAVDFVKRVDFMPSDIAFDSAFVEE